MNPALPLPPDYVDWLASLKSRIQGARQRALLSANAEQIRLFHDIGRDILERQIREGWGAKVIDQPTIGLLLCKTPIPAPTVRPIPARGDAPGFGARMTRALKGRPMGGTQRAGCAHGWAAPSGLTSILLALPGALPRAGMGCPFGAEAPGAARVDEHLKKMGAVWK